MKTHLQYFATITIIAATLSCAADLPALQGSWWKIANSHPDITPYEHVDYASPACDFTIFQDADGVWHLVACIRGTTYPGSTRFFFEWTSPSLTATNWTEKGLFMTTGTATGTDALGRSLSDIPYYTREGRLQAPHCFIEQGKWYMFYNNGGAYAFVSDNGKDWDFLAPKAPAPFPDAPYAMFTMSRDVMIFDNRDADGLWYGCFLLNTSSGAVMGARTATDLRGPWSTDHLVLQSGVNPESPFIVKHQGVYYLFEQMNVFTATSIGGFGGTPVTKLTPGTSHGYYAPEVLLVDGQYYIAGYNNNGIHLCRLYLPGNATAVSSGAVARRHAAPSVRLEHSIGQSGVIVKKTDGRRTLQVGLDGAVYRN